ncbi:MAG: HAMP domain-containing sensor histidine kinase [Acutalibacteraceae bacterium]|nr:HAMP domain-containing sensor histidine kinase [Acutalibacteraceae bacterium]
MKAKKKYIRNLKSRYSLASLSGILVCFIIFSVIQFVFMDDIFGLAMRINMLDTARKIEEIDFSDKKYPALLSEYETERNIYIEIYSPRDVLVYTSQSNDTVYNSDKNNINKTELKPRVMKLLTQNIRDDGSYFELRQEFYTPAQYIVYGTFLGNDTGIVLYSSIDVIKENARIASWALFALSLFAVIMFFAVTIYYANFFTEPVRKITSTTKKIAGMDFDESCPSFRIKELDELSENINILSASLNKALTDLKIENYQLEMDIATERKLDKARKTFIANVSHELKTPISIIQGYAEGMKYGIGCDSTEEFCDIIIDEANKMNLLVVKLMEYLQYGSGGYNPKFTQFNISQLIHDCVEKRQIQIEEAEISAELYIDEGFTGYGDTDLIANIFNNYLSNALSHIDFDKKLIIKVIPNAQSYRVSVYNSGKPIPGTDIENIWQSFYRADKSHSRKEGRFGLGLSIVATLQDLHGEKYGVINTDKGVEFWFDIKKVK